MSGFDVIGAFDDADSAAMAAERLPRQWSALVDETRVRIAAAHPADPDIMGRALTEIADLLATTVAVSVEGVPPPDGGRGSRTRLRRAIDWIGGVMESGDSGG